MNKQFLIVGLGNFGPQYRYNRHNIGSMFLEYWVKKANLIWTETPDYLIAKQKTSHGDLFLVRLKTLMNLSGIVLKKVLKQLRIEPSATLICADNLDLNLGKTSFRQHLPQNKHNGLINVQMQFMNQNIFALLLGVDRKKPLREWVLSNFSVPERKVLNAQFKLLQQTLLASVASLFTEKREQIVSIFHKHKMQIQDQRQLSNALVVIGAQWGDEGKGKIVDYLATEKYPIVCRFSGGNNAGHTIQVGMQTHKFSALPVAAIRPGKTLIIGSGCVVNLTVLIKEWKIARAMHPDLILKISDKAHLIMPYHLEQDALEEKQRIVKIGTTKQGIGPCLQDKVGRYGFRVGDLKSPQQFKIKLTEVVKQKNLLWTKIYQQPPLNSAKIATILLQQFAKITDLVSDLQSFWLGNQNQNIIFEGAQGVLLDLDFGFYPFVTSTPTTSNAIALGVNWPFPRRRINLGVFKAYVSRVGAGPLPTIMPEKTATKITNLGHEHGVVTQRLRKIGWFDAVLGKYAMRLNNFHQIALTCLDALTGIAKLKIAVHYNVNNKVVNAPIFFPPDNAKITVEYITMPGWTKALHKIRHFADLPANAQAYVKKLESLLATKIVLISVGPDRNATIVC